MTLKLVPAGTQSVAPDETAVVADILRRRLAGSNIAADVSVGGTTITISAVAALPDIERLTNPGTVTFRVVLLCAVSGGPAATHNSSPTAAATPPGQAPANVPAALIPQVTPPSPASAARPSSQCYSPLQQDNGTPPRYAASLVDPHAASGMTYTVPQDVYQRFEQADCSKPSTLEGYDPASGTVRDPNPNGDQDVVACDSTGATKFLLARAAVLGTDITSADARLITDSQGNSTGAWQVVLNLKDPGKSAFASVTNTLSSAQNQFAISVDDTVQSAPTVNQAITTGQAEISGGAIDATEARSLANFLKYGALPVTYVPDSAFTVPGILG